MTGFANSMTSSALEA
ncbi:hypothetical protein SD457_02805 [Coprobacillaceae bacterium CR2/5/TPMF4]|nr:hypothetical protein SD457_02805 [Coprobacillaceae bacterium CR2/5/TPMF4]